ncbi:hypothetical protein V8E36_004862 [Tilletia maclaganii]
MVRPGARPVLLSCSPSLLSQHMQASHLKISHGLSHLKKSTRSSYLAQIVPALCSLIYFSGLPASPRLQLSRPPTPSASSFLSPSRPSGALLGSGRGLPFFAFHTNFFCTGLDTFGGLALRQQTRSQPARTTPEYHQPLPSSSSFKGIPTFHTAAFTSIIFSSFPLHFFPYFALSLISLAGASLPLPLYLCLPLLCLCSSLQLFLSSLSTS